MQNVHRVIKCNQKVWLKPYFDMNRQVREKAKNNFEKDFELFRFRKGHRKCKKTPRYHALRKKERKKKLKSSNY